MKALVLAQFHLPWLTCIALFIFLVIFLGAIAWIYRPGSDAIHLHLTHLPLEKDN